MSSIRVNPYPMPDLLAALENLQQEQSTASMELASGSTISKPSDNPAGAAQLVEIGNTSSLLDSYEASIGSINGQLSTADSTLSSVVSVLQRAISLGVEGANGTLSDSDRTAIAGELSGIQSQLISLANTSYQGQFLFSGTAETQPFVADASAPSGVSYKGNPYSNLVTIGTGYQVQVNLPGSQVFNGSGADVFQSINDLITALNANSGIGDAVTEVTNAYNYVTEQRVFYGNAMNQAQNQQTFLNTEKVDLSQQQNTIAGADVAAVASEVASDETAMNATLDAISTMPRSSLFDYLRS
jgi:flagellar hook-associated protein 3 FlgL